ncbi:DUF2625 family protein [Streptomyces sp. CA-250714]|uniref:DUF2625 family protein n=1 Tax=Streptomyces sp. CA-250714 TaxID=3240060 RepID=UPI003D90642C
MRTADELIDTENDAWPGLSAEIEGSEYDVEVLPGDAEAGRACLRSLQVTTGSRLGAVALHSGGLVIDHGWIRVLGGCPGRDGLPGLAQANALPEVPAGAGEPAPDLIVGYDALGGVFVLNGTDPAASGRPGQPGRMVYFAPDVLGWYDMELSYGRWLTFLLWPGSATFFTRWEGWQRESAALRLDEGFSLYPFPWSAEAEGEDDFSACSRRPVPMAELLSLYRDFCGQLGKPDPGPLGFDVRAAGSGS